MFNNAFTIASFFPSALLAIIFFSKKRLKSAENKIYSYMIITTMAEVILALLSYITIINRNSLSLLNEIISKSLLVSMFLWITFLTVYVYVISSKNVFQSKTRKVLKRFMIFLCITIIITIYSLPLYYYSTSKIAYSYGPSANLCYLINVVYVVSWLFIILKDLKNIWSKKYFPLLLFIILGSVVILLQKQNP